MSTQSCVMSNCGCCVNRRRFLAAGCGVCAASTLPLAFNRSNEIQAAETDPARPRVRLVFACWAEIQDRPTWPNIGYNFAGDIERVTSSLKTLCPGVELAPVVAHSPEDAQKLLAADQTEKIDGYVVYQLNNSVNVMMPILAADRPAIIADFLYAGSGGFLKRTADMHRKGHKNFSVVASSRIEDLAEAVKCFPMLKKGAMPAEFAAACDRIRRERTAAPTDSSCKDDPLQTADVGRCIKAMKRSKLLVVGRPYPKSRLNEIMSTLGIAIAPISFEELAEACNNADREQTLALAAGWKSKARSIALDDVDGTLQKSAAMYLAQKTLLEKHKAEGITIHCLAGFYSGKLPAYPCLGFAELLDANIIGACEGDIQSATTMIAMKHLVGRTGFISDPVLDTSKRQIIYAHCVAMTKAFGPTGESNPFEILTHSEDRRGAAVRSFLPIGYKVTTLEINAQRKEILCHRAKTVENVIEDRACRTKLACEVEGDMEKLFTFWDQYGWHRVTLYGDAWEPVKELAATLKFKFISET